MRGKHLDRVRPPLTVRARALGVEPLEPGEETRMVRVRGPAHLFRVLEGLSPKERGEALGVGLRRLRYWWEPEEEEG
ncbi:hypothetical protein Theos_1699 [Thermus oshimai JL-2]|uniref:Uncharacterized protein n=1 Tax=Thermus oshimai JL-2 TaxID=751945 RepID=K7QVT9_THEOS|nr:hypothetical protein [Thermus oshimai]AFV76721.1 hypothetical protein Theos_1699 [Thermus oshimai JL-2]